MYQKGFGIIETLAPVHVGATAGEETGNLNLLFRDQFTQTGIIPGSSIRGRLRADMRQKTWQKAEQKRDEKGKLIDPAAVTNWYGKGAEKVRGEDDYESVIKIEYASIVWLPVFCPGQPIVWVTCPRLLKRYQRITGMEGDIPEPETGSNCLFEKNKETRTLFFNFGFLEVKKLSQNENQEADQSQEQKQEAKKVKELKEWFPDQKERPAVVLRDADIGLVHDMALYRQSRVALELDTKIVNDAGGFFNVEALPEETIMIFPIGMKNTKNWYEWKPIDGSQKGDLYLGGLESVGFGHCDVEIHKYESKQTQEVN